MVAQHHPRKKINEKGQLFHLLFHLFIIITILLFSFIISLPVLKWARYQFEGPVARFKGQTTLMSLKDCRPLFTAAKMLQA